MRVVISSCLALVAVLVLASEVSGQSCPACSSSQLTVDYTSDLVPAAAKTATASISLNEANWEVVFKVSGVSRLSNGHVIVGRPDVRQTPATAFTPLVDSYTAGELWNATCPGLGGIDTPAAGVTAVETGCVREYTVTYSLTDANARSHHCQLETTATDTVVSCGITLATVRAYDGSALNAFLSLETQFNASITIPRTINHDIQNLMYASLAKCSVNTALGSFFIDCRIPALFTFQAGSFAAQQSVENFIDTASCEQANAGGATFVRCALNNVPVATHTTVKANLSALVATGPVANGSGDTIAFSLEYTLFRAVNASASANLQNFIISTTMLNEKFYYGGADLATLLVEVVDTDRLTIEALEFFNSNGDVFNLRGDARFQLGETSNGTFFIIQFRPSAIREQSAFYQQGPHGVNITFQFTAARRQQVQTGFVTYTGLRVEDPEAHGKRPVIETPREDGEVDGGKTVPRRPVTSGSGEGSSTTIIIGGVAAAALVSIAAIAAAVVIARKRRPTSARHSADVEHQGKFSSVVMDDV